MEGLLLVDKPAGMSSYDVIRQLKPMLPKGIKIGHAGTLDPLATGLLIILIGKATKQAARLLKLDKTYEGQITLGATSATDDAEGPIAAASNRQPNSAEIVKTLSRFVGGITQSPPAHSAIKVGGQRAYRLARQGQAVALEPRPVTIYELTLLDYQYPRVQFVAKVGSGTYIRSLARDVGHQLGTGGYLSGLKRTQIGVYNLKDSVTPEVTPAQVEASLLPL